MTTPYIPKRPSGSDPQSRFMQWAWDMLTSYLKPIQVSGQRTCRTSRGFYSIGGAQAGSTTSSVRVLKLKDVFADYLVCRVWDGTSEGTDDVFVAKEYLHRNSIESAVILGVGYTYTYSAGPSETWAAGSSSLYNVTRTSDDGDTTEDQRIVPPWEEGEIILAVQAQTGVVDGDGIPVTLHIFGRSCQWSIEDES